MEYKENINQVLPPTVKYKNRFNNLSLKGFEAKERDVFMYIVQRVQNKNCEKIKLGIPEIKEIMQNHYSLNQLGDFLDVVRDKILMLHLDCIRPNEYVNKKGEIEIGTSSLTFMLFQYLDVRRDKDGKFQYLELAVNQPFKDLFNEFAEGQFTQFRFRDYKSLKYTSSKIMLQKLSQFVTTGSWEVPWELFVQLFEAPKSYLKRSAIIREKIITPAIEELSKANLFNDLKVEYTKGFKGKILGVKFTFVPKKRKLLPGVAQEIQERINGKLEFSDVLYSVHIDDKE